MKWDLAVQYGAPLFTFLMTELTHYMGTSKPTNWHNWWNPSYLLALTAMVAVGVARCMFETVSVEGDEVIFTNWLGHPKTRVLLDDIRSVDASIGQSEIRIYTSQRMIQVSRWLKGGDDLVSRLQLMTASPRP
jgi:hypothetical protein